MVRIRWLALTPLLFLLLHPHPAVAQAPTDSREMVPLEVATVGMDLESGAPLALLHADWQMVIPIWIGEVEAAAIADALRGVRFPRPLTHDLLVSVIAALGGELEEVRVTGVRESTYLGVLRIRTAEGVVEVDTRPSDALALAVRTGARIQAARFLVETAPDADFLSIQEERPIVRLRGITAAPPTPADQREFSLPPGDDRVMVLHAPAGAGSRGVRRGDLLLALEGAPLEGLRDFFERVSTTAPGTPLRLRVLRSGAEVEVEVPPRGQPGRAGE